MGRAVALRGSPLLLLLWLLLALTSGAQAFGSAQHSSSRALTWRTCGAGEYSNQNGRCDKCSAVLPACVECKDARTCTLCRAGYRANFRHKCVKCYDSSCLLCLNTADRCSVCKEGFYLTPAGRCVRCHEGCAGACKADGTCSTACLDGYGKVGGVCRKCQQSACSNCNGNVAACKQCFPDGGYGLVAGRCRACKAYECARCQAGNLDECAVCNYSFYKSKYGYCDPCPMGCDEASCNPDGTCRKCLPGYGLSSGYCRACEVLKSALEPYNVCEQCDGNPKRCTKCFTHFGLMPGGQCKMCSDKVSSSDVCEQCNGNVNRCSSCGSMQYLTGGGKCVTCTDTLKNCSTCTNASTCTSCWVGHTLVKGRCVACPPGCQDCTGNRSVCRRCSPFHVQNPRTLQCVPF